MTRQTQFQSFSVSEFPSAHVDRRSEPRTHRRDSFDWIQYLRSWISRLQPPIAPRFTLLIRTEQCSVGLCGLFSGPSVSEESLLFQSFEVTRSKHVLFDRTVCRSFPTASPAGRRWRRQSAIPCRGCLEE